MGKYNWTIASIEERLQRLNDMFNSEKDPKKIETLRRDITILQDYIADYYDEEEEEKLKLLEAYDGVKENLGDIPFLWQDFKDFRDFTKNGINTFITIKNCTLSKDDLLDLTHDFYRSLDHYFYGHFMKTFYRRRDHIVFRSLQGKSPYKGETINIPSLKESFIEVKRDYTIDDVFTTIHEYGHATSSAINPIHSLYPKILFSEVDAIFFELICADYLEILFKNGEPTLNKFSRHDTMCWTADELAIKIRLMEYERKLKHNFTTNKALKTGAKIACGVHPEEIEDILQDTKSIGNEIYLTSYMLALELYKIFREDKEKALYYLRKFILMECYTEEEYYSNIKRFGLVPNLSTREMHQEFQNEAMRLTRKKKNPKHN